MNTQIAAWSDWKHIILNGVISDYLLLFKEDRKGGLATTFINTSSFPPERALKETVSPACNFLLLQKSNWHVTPASRQVQLSRLQQTRKEEMVDRGAQTIDQPRIVVDLLPRLCQDPDNHPNQTQG